MSLSSSSQKDPAWNYGALLDPKNPNNVQCNFCGKILKGGITRHKQHLVRGGQNAIPHFDVIDEEEEYWEAEQQNVGHGKRYTCSYSAEGAFAASTWQPKKPKQIGLINLYFRKEADGVVQQRKGKKQKWMYDAGLPFNVVNYDSFGPAIEAIGQYGPDRLLIDEEEEEEEEEEEINFTDTDEEDVDCYKSNNDRDDDDIREEMESE
ncbi:hypothetical protein Salat_2093400 [Sesamum alatum]|uniref:BED-type domain-containing protein n=1 Tax=Sesamum alatum TaxID=300844 RepID=A0AAE2CGP1_9LAMI|nr:hypothetical protein Salat_2093400 [Sesamum alatum]